MNEELKKFISSYVNLTPEDWRLIQDNVEHVQIRKKEFLLKPGIVRSFMAFIHRGAFKSYCINESGKEIGLELFFENDMIFDLSTLSKDEPSKMYIQALEDSEISLFESKDEERVLRNHPQFKPFLAGLLQEQYTRLQRRFIEYKTLSAEARLDKLIKDHPDITQRISQQQIASYLGISPTFLSLIRKKKSKD